MFYTCLKYSLLISIISILLMLIEYFLLSHNYPWSFWIGDTLLFAISATSIYFIISKNRKNVEDFIISGAIYGCLTLVVAGILAGVFSYYYASQINPNYTQKMVDYSVARSGPYVTGGESAGVNFGASIAYSAGFMLFIKPSVLLIYGVLSSIVVGVLIQINRYRLTRHSSGREGAGGE